MKVRLAHPLYWGGPCHGRIVFDPWPFDSVPRVGESVFVGDDDATGAEGFTVNAVLWLPGEESEVELQTSGEFGHDDAHARERLARLRELGLDYGPLYRFEREPAE